ncbi:MAG: Holliday junction resolvase RuvX [Patescibacteria group bacterium]|nr:Holliday junction resolvase RuvX [Patescibacteria group bacterium]
MMYLGIDFGSKRIGLALGQMIPKGAGVIDGTKGINEISSDIKKICVDNDVEEIVIGLPKKPSGSPGELAEEIKEFSDILEKNTNLPVHFEEEQFTSVEAEEILKESGKSYSRKSGKTDEIAAILILEQYINHLSVSNKEK